MMQFLIFPIKLSIYKLYYKEEIWLLYIFISCREHTTHFVIFEFIIEKLLIFEICISILIDRYNLFLYKITL